MQRELTDAARGAVARAGMEAQELCRSYVGTEHLLLGLLHDGSCVAASILRSHDINYETTKELAGEGGTSDISAGEREMTPGLRAVISAAGEEAAKNKAGRVGTEHLLLALLRERESAAVRLIIAQSASISEIQNDIFTFFTDMSGEIKRPEQKPKIVSQPEGELGATLSFGVDLTESARKGKLGVVIGRDDETERVIRILCRKNKNNPCLIGEPGVGKTAVVEGLCLRMVAGEVPDMLLGKSVVMLDLGSMIAGAKYRGEFEERIKRVTDEVTKNKNVILFIDELHTIVGAGAAEGAIDAANILKPVLARGEIRVIGATTVAEYRHIEKDAALERRFQPVLIDEPNAEKCEKILFALRPQYQRHHGVIITDEAIRAAVKLSKRYVNDRFLPDKAIDLIDEACAEKKIRLSEPPAELKLLEAEVNGLAARRENAIISRDFTLALKLRGELAEKRAEMGIIRAEFEEKCSGKAHEVGENDVAKILEAWTKIPVSRLLSSETEKLATLEAELEKHVIGQNEAIKALARAVRRGRTGIANPSRPVCSLIFAGPTGVGKTELARAAAVALFGSEEAMVRLDMSEYMEKYSVSKLIGSPPGYVGYDEGGQLTEKIRRKPYAIVLFDEIEKAHPDIFNILLQILEDGRLTDSQGRTVDFRNTVIIMTSNVGAGNEAIHRAGFVSDAKTEAARQKASTEEALRAAFRPEFINRVDEIIVFSKLSAADMEKISEKLLAEAAERAAALGITLLCDKSVALLIAAQGETRYGARPLRRAVTKFIEDTLAEAIICGKIKPPATVTARAEENRIVYE